MHCCRTILGVRALAVCCAMLCSSLHGMAQARQPLSQREIDSIVNPRVITQKAMHFEHGEVRLGTISEDDAPVTVEFPFINRGTAPLVITRIVTTCGCTTAEYDRKPIPAGASSCVRITFDPDGHPGTLLRKTFVYTNLSQTAPSAQLVLTGSVVLTSDAWRDYPHAAGQLRLRSRTVAFRAASREGRSVESIACANSGSESLRLEIGDLPRFLKFRIQPETIAPGAEADLIFQFDGSALPVDAPDTITIPVVLNGTKASEKERIIQITITLK